MTYKRGPWRCQETPARLFLVLAARRMADEPGQFMTAVDVQPPQDIADMGFQRAGRNIQAGADIGVIVLLGQHGRDERLLAGQPEPTEKLLAFLPAQAFRAGLAFPLLALRGLRGVFG